MQTLIYCVPNANRKHDFYMLTDGEEYYLFTQDYRRGVQNFYKKRPSLNEAVDCSLSNRDTAILRTMKKLPMYIRYVEKEYGIAVLDRTRKQRRYERKETMRNQK